MSRDRVIIEGKYLGSSNCGDCNIEVKELKDFVRFEVRYDDGSVESFTISKGRAEVLQKFLLSL